MKVIQRLGVIGAGQMGTGIGIVAARAGLKVNLVDSTEAMLKRSDNFIKKWIEKEVSKQKLDAAQAQQLLQNFSFSKQLQDLQQSDFAVEAVTENFEVKKLIFEQLDKILPQESIIASNTSSISITQLAAVTKRPSQVIGMHFMNPVPVMTLVEVIKGLQTSSQTLQQTKALATVLGKTTVDSRDVPGFIINRVLMPYINEAVFVLYEGIATVEEIDKGMKLGTNIPMGPLTLADFIGLDTCLSIMEVLHQELGDSKYRPCPLLKNYVLAGWLGKKSGRGFYKYS